MDDNGTKVLPKKLPPLPPNRILPKEIDNEASHSEGGPVSEMPHVNEIQETQRSDRAQLVEETLPPNQPSSDKTIEGRVSRLNKITWSWEACHYIMIYQHQLSVYKGLSKEGELLNQCGFPHGAEYRFSGDYLDIFDENGQEIRLCIGNQQLFNDIWIEWLNTTRIFTDLKRESAEDNAIDDFYEKNYSLEFNPPSFRREFGNVFNEHCMTLFQHYPIVDGKPQIKNALEFQHFFRPNRHLTSNEQECSEEIEKHMTDIDRKFIQWAPSRDWSRLFVVSGISAGEWVYRCYLEFYDFNKEKQTNLSSSLRMNFLSQLLRPKWIISVDFIDKYEASQAQIEASFNSETIVMRYDKRRFSIIQLNSDWTFKEYRYFDFETASIESLTLSFSHLYVKSNGFYYEQSVSYINDNYKEDKNLISFDQDFIKNTTLNNIIQCGIYDILVFDEHVKILSNIEPSKESDAIEVDADTLKLLQSSKFTQLDHQQIACLPQPHNNEAKLIIITIQQDKLAMRESSSIPLKSPWITLPSDCLFNVVKFKESYDAGYAVLIVSSASKSEQFYQYYRENDHSVFLANQKPLNDYINLRQIPHLPLVSINGTQFIDCDGYLDNHQLELDLRLDEQEILNLDQENINCQEVEVYSPNFKKYLFRLIEENEKIFDKQTLSEIEFSSIEIPELRTSIIIKSGGQNSGVLIFQHSIEKIKQLKMKQAILYKTHKVIYRNSSYYVSIILQVENALYEMRMRFDLTGANLQPLKLIMKLKEAENQHEIYLNDDFSVSMLFPASDCCFKYFSLNSLNEQEESIKIDIKDLKSQSNIHLLTSFIKRIACSKSITIGQQFLENFKSIIFKNAEGFNKEDLTASVFAFQNKMIVFEKGVNSLTIMDDQFTVIGTVILSERFAPSIIRIAPSIDAEALECIDELNNKFPIPILGNLLDYKQYNERLNNYTKNFRYPMPIQFAFLDGFISHFDLVSEKLSFFKSHKDIKDGNISARIEVIVSRESFMDKIINCSERKEIEKIMKDIKINELLTYNVNKRMNLITGTKDHTEIDHIYNVLYKLLEIAEIKDLPMMIYNTSVEPNKYECILDVLVKKKAYKLALLIVSIAIKQDQIGYIYSRLYQYLSIFSANELQLFFENQIFFFKIPLDCYKEYQIVKNTLIRPLSNHKTFSEIYKNMKSVESYILKIEEGEARTEIQDSDNQQEENKGESQIEGDGVRVEEIKDSNNLEQGNERNKVIKIIETVSTEYLAINLMNLIQSMNHQSLNEIHENHREVTKMLNKIAEIDESIIEKESFQIIVDFKWHSYAQKFFSIQLGLFICFIISFILDVVAVNKNSHVFSSDDSNQVIPRIISISILIPFAIYEIANILVTRSYFGSFWNFIDILLIPLYVAYFTSSFARPEQKDVLKSLQLLIVILSFIKFSFLIRIWTQVSFLVRMLLDVFKELRIFLFFFLLVIGCLTVMAYIIMAESGDAYNGIKSVAYFVIILRQALGDTDTSSIIDGSKEFQILAWLLWLLILIIGNVVFMNFIIAVVSESYEGCMERKLLLIYKAKLEMITECEDLMPDWCFTKENWFPRFIIIRREQGSSEGGDSSDEWYGFVKQMQKHLQHETNKLNDMFIQNINRSTENTKREIAEVKKDSAEVKKDTVEVKTSQEAMKKDVAEVKKDVTEVKKDVAEVKVQINEMNLILSAVFKDQIAIIKAKEAQVNDIKAI